MYKCLIPFAFGDSRKRPRAAHAQSDGITNNTAKRNLRVTYPCSGQLIDELRQAGAAPFAWQLFGR